MESIWNARRNVDLCQVLALRRGGKVVERKRGGLQHGSHRGPGYKILKYHDKCYLIVVLLKMGLKSGDAT